MFGVSSSPHIFHIAAVVNYKHAIFVCLRVISSQIDDGLIMAKISDIPFTLPKYLTYGVYGMYVSLQTNEQGCNSSNNKPSQFKSITYIAIDGKLRIIRWERLIIEFLKLKYYDMFSAKFDSFCMLDKFLTFGNLLYIIRIVSLNLPLK